MFVPDTKLHLFTGDQPLPEPPERFTFPFHYAVHPLAARAAADLQSHLQAQTDWQHDFGLETPGVGARGKMFGVLVVRSRLGITGYLAAYSGKLADSNHLPGFVPPVYDTLRSEGFYKQGERRLLRINAEVDRLQKSEELRAARAHLAAVEAQAERELKAEADRRRAAKAIRRQTRAEQRPLLSATDFAALEERLARESVARHFVYKDLGRQWQERTVAATAAVEKITTRIAQLQALRKHYSRFLQMRIFRQYRFLDATGVTRDLPDIFAETIFQIPPAGAGECAAPKLLQYAYQHQLEPLCMAEFWWGQSPGSEIRRHQHFYPACRGKCEPILGHMLQGLAVDPNPMLRNPAAGRALTILQEDDSLIIVNKPPDFLSVPGKNIQDSVATRIRAQYPEATGPLVVHRLDMGTSGLLLLAKNKAAHKALQRQFLDRSIRKRYVALLDGEVAEEEGEITLPLRLDIEDRPRQLVCPQHGKPARTRWAVVARLPGKTRVHFWPITGRTHQLRVHAAHPLGLNAPIVGDDLYGQAADRLHLHAETLTFVHPVTGKKRTLRAAPDF